MGYLSADNSPIRNFNLMANGVIFTQNAQEAYTAYHQNESDIRPLICLIAFIAIATFAFYTIWTSSFLLGSLYLVASLPFYARFVNDEVKRMHWIATVNLELQNFDFESIELFMQDANIARNGRLLDSWTNAKETAIYLRQFPHKDIFNDFINNREKKETVYQEGETLSLLELREKARTIELHLQDWVNTFKGTPFIFNPTFLIEQARSLQEYSFKISIVSDSQIKRMPDSIGSYGMRIFCTENKGSPFRRESPYSNIFVLERDNDVIYQGIQIE